MPMYNGVCADLKCAAKQEVLTNKSYEIGEVMPEKCEKCGHVGLVKTISTGNVGLGGLSTPGVKG